MTDTTLILVPTPGEPPAPKPETPASVPSAAYVVTDPGDASPIGRADESDFVPQGQVLHPLTVLPK